LGDDNNNILMPKKAVCLQTCTCRLGDDNNILMSKKAVRLQNYTCRCRDCIYILFYVQVIV
jgi:hypothetical protein